MRTLVIAEPGCTHEGDYDTIVRLLETAKACGADVFKNQWTSNPDAMVARRRVPPEYRRYYGWLNYPVEWHADFKAMCGRLGMQYGCSVYLSQDVDTIEPLVDYIKVSSFENGDKATMKAAINYPASRVIFSLGMGGEWPFVFLAGHQLLHCVSSYPAPLDAMNLRLIGDPVPPHGRAKYWGLSDHSRHPIAGAVAVARGATIIETHFRLTDCKPDNPDFSVAFEPWEFQEYIQNIRDAEVMLGDGIKRVQPCEESMLRYRVTG